jgi:Xaa-Pro aminopeptidase
MSSPFNHAQRRDRLRQRLAALNLDLLLITRPVNVRYLTGFSGDSTALLCLPGKDLLVSDGRYTEQLARECPEVDSFIRPPSVTLVMALAEVLRSTNAHRIGIEANHVTVAEAETWRESVPQASWKPCQDAVETLRRVKDPAEVAAITQAIGMAERSWETLQPLLSRLETESEVAAELERHMRREGAVGSAFPTIVAAGANAALPHYHPGAVLLSGASQLLVDWGAQEKHGYRSDLTRVLAWQKVDGMPGLDEAYTAAVAAQTAGAAELRPGNTAGDVDRAVRSVLATHGVEHLFVHGSGHGIGLDIHEAPFFRPGNAQELQAGMVVTLEPGIYCPGRLGMRIEDDYLVTPDGGVRLSRLPQGMNPGIG